MRRPHKHALAWPATILLLGVALSALVGVAAKDEDIWQELAPEQWEEDGDSQYLLRSATLRPTQAAAAQERGEGDNATRFTFDLGAIFVGMSPWDPADAGRSQMYEDLDLMRGLQLSVAFSECEDENADRGEPSRCWHHGGPKGAWLGVQADELYPSAYAQPNVSNSEINIHTSFCRHTPLSSPWYLAVSGVPTTPNTTVAVTLRVELVRVHGVGSTRLVLSNPTVVLLALPIETTGWDKEQAGVVARAQRASEAPGNANIDSLGHVVLSTHGVARSCPELPPLMDHGQMKAREAANGGIVFDEHNERLVQVHDTFMVEPQERSMWYVLLHYAPPPTTLRRFIVDVTMTIDGAAADLHNCTNSCVDRHARAISLLKSAAMLPLAKAYPMLQQLRLLYPRRSFPATRFADRAQEAGNSQIKWQRYEQACRIIALEVALQPHIPLDPIASGPLNPRPGALNLNLSCKKAR
jgi:hypothetical protein